MLNTDVLTKRRRKLQDEMATPWSRVRQDTLQLCVLSQAYIMFQTKERREESLSEGVPHLYHFQGVPSPVVLAFARHVILSLTSGARTTTGQMPKYNA
jgi:hypothetical protein